MVYSAAQGHPGGEAYWQQVGGVDCTFDHKMAQLGSLLGRNCSFDQAAEQPRLSGRPPCVCTTPEPDEEEDMACQFGDFVPPPSPAPSTAAQSTATPTDSLQELDSRPCILVVQGTFIQAVPDPDADAPRPQQLQRSQTAPARGPLLQRAQTDSVLAVQALQACTFEAFNLPESDCDGSAAIPAPAVTSAPPPPAAQDLSAAARWETAQPPLQDAWAAPAQGAEEAAWAQGGLEPEGVAWAQVQAGVDHGVSQEMACPVMMIDAAVLAEVVQNVQPQIEYYLSDTNLQADDFFHQKISESPEGWLDIELFMNCNKIRTMGASYEMLQVAACQSTEMELREDWRAVRRAGGLPLPPLLRAAPALPAPTPPPPPQGGPLEFGEHDAEGRRKGQELLSLLVASQDPQADEVHDADQACRRPRLGTQTPSRREKSTTEVFGGPPRSHQRGEADGEMGRAGLDEGTAELSCPGPLPSEKELKTGGLVTAKALSALLRCPERILELCFEEPGCRRIQDALEVGGREEQLKVARAIGGSVRKLLQSPQGNFVVQKLVKVMLPEDTAFVAQEVLGEAARVAKSQCGCRGIQRLVEKCLHLPSTQALLAELFRDPQAIRDLCRHPYGHYVVQGVLECGLGACALDPATGATAADLRGRVAGALLGDLPRLAAHKSASYVVERAMTSCDAEARAQFCRSLTEPEVVRALAASRGVYVLRAISKKSKELQDVVRGALSDDWLISEEGQKAQARKHARMLLEDLGLLRDGPDAEGAAGGEAA